MNIEAAERLADAIKNHEAVPKMPETGSLEEAYALQVAVTEKRATNGIGGIKAGVTAEPVQQLFGLNHALIASLYEDSKYENNAKLPFLEGRGVECEVAVIIDADGRPQQIAPAIELVYVKFAQPEDMSVENLVVINLGADAYIVGDFQPWQPEFNDLQATLFFGDEVVNQANMSDAIGGPESASKWMWQEAAVRGLNAGEGTLLLTGACGQVVPGNSGSYRADYGPLGDIVFEIE